MGGLSLDRRIRLVFLIGLIILLASAIFSGCRGGISGSAVLEDNGLKSDNEDRQKETAQPSSILGEEEIVLSSEGGSVIKVINDGTMPAFPSARPSQIEMLKQHSYVSNDLVEQLSKHSRVRVIIKLKNNDKKQEIMGNLEKQKEIKNYISGHNNKETIVKIINEMGSDNIERIDIDHIISLEADSVTEHIGAEQSWAAGFTGKGQAVCVIDSGIDYTHPALAAKYIGGYDFVNNDADPVDDNGHGTYVAGIVAGIAPDARIVAVKAFGEDGLGYESDIIAAIDYCVQNKDAYGISVILMAFGGGFYNTSCFCDSNFVVEEAHYAISQGLFAVAASGNDGEAYLKAPACGSNVTSVGAVDRNDAVAGFTNIEPLLDLLAPGVDIESAQMGGGTGSASGTSASAAVAAGAAALLLEKEALAPLDLQYRLRSTGALIQHQGTAYPRVDAYAAIMNDVTNAPSEQLGTQCEGEWDGYDLLYLPSCMGPLFCGGPGDPSCECCHQSDTYKKCVNWDCDLGACLPGTETCSCSITDCGAQCESDSNCGAGICDTNTCRCNYVTNCTGRGCFFVNNAAGSTLVKFDSYGNLDVFGYIYPSSSGHINCTSCSNCLKIFNSTGSCVAYINHTSTNITRIWLDGSVSQNTASCIGTGFMIKNSTGTVVALINQSGGLCLRGVYDDYTI